MYTQFSNGLLCFFIKINIVVFTLSISYRLAFIFSQISGRAVRLGNRLE